MTAHRTLVVGARGMLGHTLLRVLRARGVDAWGTVRSGPETAPPGLVSRVVTGVDATRVETVRAAIGNIAPAVVVNCVGIIKQLPEAKDPVRSIEINALFPHLLAREAARAGARVVHVSTDCVFSGRRGGYREDDPPDPEDLYGRSKLLGELDASEGLTLRTSIIGHELGTRHGLVEWFLGERGAVQGFTRAIYTGLPTVVISEVIAEHVLPRPELRGLYHVGSEPISKYDLLGLVARQYGLDVRIEASERIACDRSFDSSRFRAATGWAPSSWPGLVARMHADHLQTLAHAGGPTGATE